MARFSKNDMLDELRTIFLFEADHLLMGAGEKAALSFIGFLPPENGEYCFEAPDTVDLARFPIADKFARGYDIAFSPSVLTAFDGSEFQDLLTFMSGTPRTGGITSGGETHRFMTPDGYCQMVADAAYARWELEWNDISTHTFTTRELALLSNMTEGAVRNAISDKSDDGLRAIPGKKPVSVERSEALRWLKARRGFIPSPQRPSEDRFLTEHLREIQSAETLGKFVERQLWSTFGSPEAAASALGWTADEIQKWRNGLFEFDQSRTSQLAQALDLDAPLFMGKTLELTLRRVDGGTEK